MIDIPRIIIDTNVLVSGMVFMQGVPQQAINKALERGVLLFTPDTLQEFKDVVLRPKFNKYIEYNLRAAYFFEISTSSIMAEPKASLHVCRDPKDQKYLEAYEGGEARYLISGDQDLLVLKNDTLHVLKPDEFLRTVLEIS